MDSSHVSTLIDLLSSGKLKDRNHGLEELTSLLKLDSTSIPSKYLYSLLQVLIDIIELERTKYERLVSDEVHSSESKLTAIDNRLSSASYVVRLLIQTCNANFKSKHVKYVVATLPNLMIDVATGDLATSVSLHLLSSLETLINSECFRLKFEPHQWTSLVEKMSTLLSTHLNHSLSSKNVHCLMDILSSLLLLNTTCLMEVESHFIEPLVKYLSNSKTENATSKAALHLLNTYILQTHLLSYFNCLEVMETAIRYFLSIGKFNTSGLAHEFAVFNIFLSTLINSPLYLKIQTGELTANFDTDRFLDILEDYTAATLTNYDPDTLELESFQFKENNSKKSWLEFPDFQLRCGFDSNLCIEAFGVTQLLRTFFCLKDAQREDPEEGLLFKKVRRDKTIAAFLKNAPGVAELIAYLVESGKEKLQLLGLQLCGFYATNFMLHPSQRHCLAIAVFQNFEIRQLEGWVCFALLPLVSDGDSQVSLSLIQRIFVLCLPFVKSRVLCRSSCALLKSLVMCYGRELVSDSSICQQIHHLFDLADVNGPALVLDESFAFWKCLAEIELPLTFLEQLSPSVCIVAWLNCKWEQIDFAKPCQEHFSQFVAWLAGISPGSEDLREISLNTAHSSPYFPTWDNYDEERQFLLASCGGVSRPKVLKLSARPYRESNELFQTWGRFIDYPRDPTRGDVAKLKWCCEAVKLGFYLSGNQNFANRLEDLSDQIATVANGIHDVCSLFSRSVLDEIYRLGSFSSRSHIIFSNLGISNPLEELKKILLRESISNFRDDLVDDFETSREMRSQSSTPRPCSNKLADENIAVLNDVLKLFSVRGLPIFGVSDEEKLTNLFGFLRGLPENYITVAVPAVSHFLQNLDENPTYSSLLEDLTQLIASTLLGAKFNTSNEAMSVLAIYLNSIRWAWLSNKNDNLEADLTDIFQWIIAKLDESLFCGINTITSISRLLLNMLRFHDLSQGAVTGGKQKVFGDLVTCIRRLPLFTISKALTGIHLYLSQISFKNQGIVFAEIATIFESSSISLEIPAFHSLILSKTAAASTCQAVLSALDMMSGRGNSFIWFYGKRCLDMLAQSDGLSSTRQLFVSCRFEVIDHWYKKSLDNPSKNFNSWQASAFDFDLDTFLKEFSIELAAVYFSQKTKLSFLKETLLKISGKREADLLVDCLHLVLPLCHATVRNADEIVRQLRSTLGKQYAKLMGTLSHEITYWVLHFTEVDVLSDLVSASKKLFPKSTILEALLAGSSSKLKSQSHIRIAALASLSLLKVHIDAHRWDSRDLDFLLLRLAADLEVTKPTHLKVNIIRQMKCVLLLGESFLENCTCLARLVRVLARTFNIKDLRMESQDLIKSVISPLCLSADRYEGAVEMYAAVFSCLLTDYSSSDNLIVEALEHQVKFEGSRAIRKYDNLWNACLSILKGDILSEDVYMNDDLLKTDFPSKERFTLLSQIYQYHAEPRQFPLSYEFSHQVTSNLLVLPDLPTATTPNFDLWRGYYVGGYYLKFASLPKQLSTKPILAQNTAIPLVNVVAEINEFRNTTTSSESYFFISAVLSLMAGTVSKDCAQEAYSCEVFPLSDRELRLLPTLRNAFVVENVSLGEAIDAAKRTPFMQWMANLVTALSYEIDYLLPGFRAVAALAYEKLNFLETLFLYMFLVLERMDSKRAFSFISLFFKTCDMLTTESDIVDSRPKTLLLLHVFSLVRSEAMKGNSSLKKLYLGFDLKKFFNLASTVNMVKLAFMLFEEFTTKVNPDDVELLQPVLYALGDSDLTQALPIEPSLEHAFSTVNEFDSRSIKNFMFNNCKFDVDTAMGKSPQKNDLIRASSMNGFKGLADLLRNVNTAQDCSKKQDPFEWYLRLNRWDVPVPEYLSSDSSAIYALSKKLINSPDNGTIELVRNHLKKVVADSTLFHSKRAWAGSLVATICAEMFYEHADNESVLKALVDQTESYDVKCIENTSFFDHQTQMKGRQNILGVSSNKHSTENSVANLKFCELLEIWKYAFLSRENNDLQESLTSAMLLDKKVTSLAVPSDSGLWKRLAHFEGAQALWLQGDYQIAISMLEGLSQSFDDVNADRNLLESKASFSQVQLKARLVEWTSLLRKENAQSIYAKYISETGSEVSAVEEYNDRAKIFLQFGEFCLKQLRRLENDTTANERQSRSDYGKVELSGLLEIVRDSNANERDRKEARKHFNRLKLQIEQDQEILVNLFKQQKLFAWKSVHFFLSALVYGNQLDDDVLDKFCGLWFQYADDGDLNSKLYHEISSIPSFKFVPWIHQLTSRLSIDSTPFQRNLQLTLKRVMFKLPNETLYPLVSLKLYKKVQPINDPGILLRVKAVEKLFEELERYDSGHFLREYLDPIEEFCEKAVDFSCMKAPKDSRSLDLRSWRSGKYWLESIGQRSLSLPTNPAIITCSADGRKLRPTITHLDPVVQISSSGLSLPKIATFYLSDGTKHKVLLKGSNDDLRQDSIMEQVFKQVNQILIKNEQTRKRNLRVRTYEVVPLGPRAGLIEFVANSVSLHEVLSKLHRNDEMPFEKARKLMKQCQSKPLKDRVGTYSFICDSIKPQLRSFFFQSFVDAQEWLDAKYAYTKGVVTTSIVGYVLGLGDRHLNNILLDKSNGEPVHIDLGVAFDQGKFLAIPELVPFRLTREMVDGFGVTGVDGIFRNNCERVFSVLHKERDRVMSVLNVLKWDPLYSWVVSPLRKKKLQANFSDDSAELEINASAIGLKENNNESMRALKDVETKLEGNGLSVEATVQELIQQATDVNNLATIYMGWSPFY
ncbi:LAFA_0D05072g1_1 [Lachancea sp. 'fantastica']|nr:LAFA_0D05072g1_1 [Lachancea sp. 'fantastica']